MMHGLRLIRMWVPWCRASAGALSSQEGGGVDCMQARIASHRIASHRMMSTSSTQDVTLLRSRRPADLNEYHMLISYLYLVLKYTTTRVLALVEERRKRSFPFRWLVLVTFKCACITTLDARGTTDTRERESESCLSGTPLLLVGSLRSVSSTSTCTCRSTCR